MLRVLSAIISHKSLLISTRMYGREIMMYGKQKKSLKIKAVQMDKRAMIGGIKELENWLAFIKK